MAEKFIHLVIRWRWLVILLTLATVVGSAAGLKNGRFDTDYRVFFSGDNPQLIAFDTLQATYTKNDNVMFVLAPQDGQIFTRDMLEIVRELTKESWQIPYSIRVDSITNFQNTEAEEDDLIVADLVEDPAALTDADLEHVKQIALAEPMLRNRLIAPAADVTGVNVTIQLPDDIKDKAVPEVAAFVRKMADKLRAEHPDLTVHLTGMVMMNNAFPESSKRDMGTLIPAMFGVVLLMLAFMLRSFWGVLGTLLVILFSILTGMGLAFWGGIVLTGPSSASPTIILTMAVADCVHILATFLHHYGAYGDKRAQITESMRVNFQPVFLTSLTTALGFLSMNFSDSPPFHDLGNIVTIGVIAAFVYSVTFLPAFMAIAPVRQPKPRKHSTRAMDRMGDFVVAKRRALLPLMLAASAGLIAFLPSNELNDEFVKYFNPRMPFRQAADFSTERLTGLYIIDYSIDSGNAGGVADPEFLANVEKFAQWYRQQPETIHVGSITDTFKRLNKNMHGGSDDWYKLPEARDLSAQYLLLYEMSLPYGLDLNNQINVDKSKTRFTVTVENLSSSAVIALTDRADAWMAANLPEGMRAVGSSPTVMFAHIGQSNIHSMLTGTTVALVLISLTLIVAMRSIKIGLLSLIPNLVPAGMAFGLWAMIDGQVGLALSVVAGMTLGIIVDDTVHFLSKYLRARREKGLDPENAVRYAFHTVGLALVVTTVVLVCGFLVLTNSNFKLNADMGLLTAIAIFLALVVDFLLLPPLLMKLEEKKSAQNDNDTDASDRAVRQPVAVGADA
ncbi:efflux RND transporter permease subunit [Magnetofaba australis]|uniref:Putative RND efflux transporter n=1 Tax=Magnetofaba australis IT-1 TaxID=1434232 RepID=A0A1Y2K1A8_9PROT|nr:efflux RND transporter permease subunit [Magnetofaba australis]OSM01406.1 putative RND efflux transporter [Magnetofaba australis IT-1]